MVRTSLWTALLAATLLAAQPAGADFEAGQRAWDAGRPDEALAEWRAGAGAAAGERRAMLALGRLYVQGLGVLQDYVEGHKWLNLAASRGEIAALTERDALAAKMTPRQIAAAQERAAAWRPEASEASEAGGSTDAGDASETVTAATASPSPSPAATASAQPSPPPSTPPPPHAIREAQALLAALGYEVGSADGKWGPRSSQAYRAFVRDAGLPGADMLTLDALRTMRRIAARHGATPPPAPAPAPEVGSRRAATSGDVLHRAAKAGEIEVLNALLAAGADVDGRDGRGWTALMHAANEGQGPVTELLLAGPVDPDDRAPDGATALFIAVSRGYPEIIALLRNAGADPWLAGPNGRTAAPRRERRAPAATPRLSRHSGCPVTAMSSGTARNARSWRWCGRART